MATKKIGEESRKTLVFHITESLKSFGFDVLQTGSNTFAVPIVEDGEEGAEGRREEGEKVRKEGLKKRGETLFFYIMNA